MTSDLDRRVFLRHLIAAAALSPSMARLLGEHERRAGAPLSRAAGPILRVGLLTTGRAVRDRHDGVLLGVEEAKQAARLFGGGAELVAVGDLTRLPASLSAIVGDEREDHCLSLLRASRAANGAPLVMNVACASDALRGAECAPSLFHLFPSDAMIRDVRTQAPGATEVAVWDESLIRFGADTLNGRFEKRFGRPMTPQAWTSWFAVKALWESSLRMKSADARQLADYLTRDTTQFDGHKGRPLSFRPWDRQLRQFLYARVGGKLVDVPQNAPEDMSSHEFLDRLGTPAARSACHAS